MSFYANELREHGRNDFDHAAADELDRLEDENSMLREALADIGMTPAEARAGVQRSRENKRDAARYRWLRDRLLCADFDWQGTQALVFELPQGARVSASCDATIDAAMAMPANFPHEGPSGASREGPLDAVVGAHGTTEE